MQVRKTTAVTLLSAAALAGAATTAVTAFGHDGGSDHNNRGHGGQALLATTLAPSIPGDPVLHGVSPGAVPWVLRNGAARLRADGRLRLNVRGLVIPVAPGNGTPGPVTTISASLYCGNDTTAAATTPAVPLSSHGDARIQARVPLPATCLAPVVMVHPNGNAAAYIAVSGFRG
jgi:hypothetical protein